MAEPISRELIDRYTAELSGLSDELKHDLLDTLKYVDLSDIASARNEILTIMEMYLAPYTDMAAQIAATFYEGLRATQVRGAYTALVDSGRDAAGTEGAVRAIMQTLVDGGSEDEFYNKLVSRAGYEMNRAAGECTMRNIKRDPKKPRFARVPQMTYTQYTPWEDGGTHNKYLATHGTCQFCEMLASRGWVYYSKETAGEGNHYHDGCNCKIVPSWNKAGVQGYDPDYYLERYKAGFEE